jgi:hypothetical protein
LIEQSPNLMRDGWGFDVVRDGVVMANLAADFILLHGGVF